MSEKSIESAQCFDKNEINLELKLRRLKLQENLLLKGIEKKSEDYADENIGNDNVNHLEYMALIVKLRNRFIDIRDLFEDIKLNIKSGNEAIDIETVKKNVIDLDIRIKSTKSFVLSQLLSLKSKEEELIEQIKLCFNHREKIHKMVKIKSNSLKNNISSPVKNIISSPLKCSEVQEFQKFMASSKNRYGGWVLYNHSIFEKAWQNFFGAQMYYENSEHHDTNIEKFVDFNLFVDDVCRKIPGISSDEVMLHNKWYTKYLFLKNRQQRALQKWKTNKQLIKKAQKARNITKLTKSIRTQADSSKETNGEHSERDRVTLRRPSLYMQATEQWNNKIKFNRSEKSVDGNMDVESIDRRGTPKWRLSLL